MANTKASASSEISIMQVDRGQIDVYILGTSPLILNRMSQKVWQELLAPKGRKGAVERASTMKHDPLTEFRASPYMTIDPKSPTALGILPTAFKRAMGTAALSTPGAKRTEIGRLVYVPGEIVPLFGIPKVYMAITRSADMARTPDVRTRALLPEWCCALSIQFTQPILKQQSIVNLLAAAGFQSGVGDWRQEKGSGSYGSFELVSADHPDVVRLMATAGRDAQMEALDHPQAYNDETREMLEWFNIELQRRGFEHAGGKLVKTTHGGSDDAITVTAPAKRGRKANGGAVAM